MMPMVRLLRRLLLGASVGLAGYSVYEWTRPYVAPDVVPSVKQDTAALLTTVSASTYNLPPVETFAEILERPLFRADRRPYTAPQPVTVDEPAPAPVPEIPLTEQVALRATIIIGEKRIALLHDMVNDSPLRLSQGDSVHGWTLAEVGTNSVALQKGGMTERLALQQE
ncbi:MAG: hypothetical protein OXD47_04285 [Gammaproteobacteria bacterium]|nr:hypothetical protein [Gammaproteobacteria bacterium]